MFFSAIQIVESAKRLENINPFFGTTFLVFKKGQLPVGETKPFHIDADNKDFLNQYYRPSDRSEWFYRLFRPSDKNKHWNRPDYAAKGLQSVNTRTFGNAFEHPKDSNIWGWKPNYIQVLEKHLGRTKIPIFDLAVWLYRQRDWLPQTTAQDVVNAFKEEFRITEEEEQKLFEPPSLLQQPELQPNQASWHEIDEILDLNPPPDFSPDEGGILSALTLQGVGPARTLKFEPAERLNLITGDNGLGKTFLMECAWWALTGDWADQAAYPRTDSKSNEPKISFQITGKQKSKPITVAYDRATSTWRSPKKRSTISGLIVYARVDGSFAVWDPMMNRHLVESDIDKPSSSQYLVFTREQVWDGEPGKIEGLLRDWVRWQVQPEKYPFGTFLSVLERLSPPEIKLEAIEPIRLPGYSIEIPVLRHPYGEIPIVYASAGIRRIITLAYLIVWAWNEHKVYSGIARKEPQSNLVILVDEMEAHLHPKWQRSVLPALLDVREELADDLQVQLMVATHSPLVTASIEPCFDEEKDKLFHLDLTATGEVKLEEHHFLKYGPVDSWLTSDIFGLKQPYGTEAEQAILAALALQENDHPDPEEVKRVSAELVRLLPPDDKFWPRWLYFAEMNGVKM